MYGLRLLSETVPKVTGKLFSRKYTMLGRLVTHWEEIVGKDLATKTQPVKIRYMKAKNGKKRPQATLEIASPTADATLLHYQKDLMLERMNRIFGECWITAIRFVPVASNESEKRPKKRPIALTNTEKTGLSDLLKDIEDPDIKEKLQNLGTAILQDQKK